MADIKLVLVGGTSHVGKSTLSQRLAGELGWHYLSTDQLARHPGRPWKVGDREVPDDVVEHYASLSVVELVDSVLEHYRSNVWPIVNAIVHSRLNNPFDPGLVLEGSAILPERVAEADYPGLRAVWLTAPDQLITERIRHNSDYGKGKLRARQLVDTFVQRTLAIDRVLKASVEQNEQCMLDTSSADVLEVLLQLSSGEIS